MLVYGPVTELSNSVIRNISFFCGDQIVSSVCSSMKLVSRKLYQSSSTFFSICQPTTLIHFNRPPPFNPRQSRNLGMQLPYWKSIPAFTQLLDTILSLIPSNEHRVVHINYRPVRTAATIYESSDDSSELVTNRLVNAGKLV